MSDLQAFARFASENPEEAYKLIQRLKGKVVVPHDGQKPVLASKARFKVLNCGRRWGKTVIGAKLLIDATMKAPEGSVTWWVAPTYKVVKRGYREVLRQLPRDYLTHDPPPDTNFDAGRSVILKFKNGTQIEFYSAERPEGMLGEGVAFVVMDEAATMPSRIWQQIVAPTLMDKQGGACLISTPRGRNWFHKQWLRGQDPDNKMWDSWTFPTSSNPYIEPSEIKELLDSLPTVIFEQEVLAKFVASGSSVFQWDERYVQRDAIYDNGTVEDCAPSGTVFLGIDLAKTRDYTVLYGARELDRRNVYYERFNSVKWSEQRRRIARAVGKLMNSGAENVILMMDSTGVGDPIVEAMDEAGFDVIGLNFTTFKNKMVMLLAKDLETGKAFLLDDAMIPEFENFMMKQTEAGRITYQAPEGEHDDVVAAKMLSHWGCVNEGSPSVSIMDGSGDESQEREREIWEQWEDDDSDGEDFSDLVDTDLDDEDNAAGAIGLDVLGREPTVQELLHNPALWI